MLLTNSIHLDMLYKITQNCSEIQRNENEYKINTVLKAFNKNLKRSLYICMHSEFDLKMSNE